jgi:hypothetical protein
MLQPGRSRVRVTTRWIFSTFLILPAATMLLGSTQTLTEMSTRSCLGGGGKGRSALKADNLTAICELIV